MTDKLPLMVDCTCRLPTEKGGRRQCPGIAKIERGADGEGHALYRCQHAHCRGLVVVCVNPAHQPFASGASGASA